MQNYAINNRLTPFISMQNHYNLVYREEEREMMPTLEVSPNSTFVEAILIHTQHFGVGSIPWSPLARGMVARPWNTGSSDRKVNDRSYTQYSKGAESEEIVKRYARTLAIVMSC
jgi:aryl-alcohol dehydrogenase-like predicted oxidoreductase